MGSIDFLVGDAPYESSHNLFLDILYRNGLLFLLGYLYILARLFLNFIKYRRKEYLPMFGIFVFVHFELMVNPCIYAAQIGWIYAFLLARFIRNRGLAERSLESFTGS